MSRAVPRSGTRCTSSVGVELAGSGTKRGLAVGEIQRVRRGSGTGGSGKCGQLLQGRPGGGSTGLGDLGEVLDGLRLEASW